MTDYNQDSFVCTCGHDRTKHPNTKKCTKCDCDGFKPKSELSEQEQGLKELGIVVEDKDVAFWKEQLEMAEKIGIGYENNLKFNKAVIDMCKERIRAKDASYIG